MPKHNNKLPKSIHFSLKEIAEGIYAAFAAEGGGAMGNAGIVDLGDRTVIFDTFESFQDNNIGMVKWIKQAKDDGKLSLDDPVIASKQFLALIETFALWPQLYGVKPVPTKKQQQTIIHSAIDMFLCTYGVAD